MENEMTAFTRRSVLRMGLLGSLSLSGIVPASALVRITVTAGDFIPLPIAVPDFASSDPSFGRDVSNVIRADLQRSGLFQVLDPAGLPLQTGDANASPDFESWRTTGADALVMGTVNR
ncbi:MAG TPA: hypothetical protein VGA68_10155, partial [Woeseiaceae bacterium]